MQNTCFLGNLIPVTASELYHDDITVTSFRNIKYGDATTEIDPQWTVCRYSFLAAKTLGAFHSNICPV